MRRAPGPGSLDNRRLQKLFAVQDLWTEHYLSTSSEKSCPSPCRSSEYKLAHTALGMDNGMTSIELSYVSTYVLTRTEYYIYSFSGALGVVGGSLGMFLGFSFWEIGRNFLRIGNMKAELFN